MASLSCGESANSSVGKYSNSAELDDDDMEQRIYDRTPNINKNKFSNTKTAATVVAAQVDSDCSKIEVKYFFPKKIFDQRFIKPLIFYVFFFLFFF